MIWRWLMGRDDERTIIAVERTGTLFGLLSGFLNAYKARTEAIGGGLHAVALALSTPQDNSEQVQQAINQYASRIGSQEAALKDAVEKHKGD